MSQSEKVQLLMQMCSMESIITLDSYAFKKFVHSVDRNYSMVVLFTAMEPPKSCASCGYIVRELEQVANSYRASSTFANNLFFASIDYNDGPNIFDLHEIGSDPVLIHFPPYNAPQPDDIVDVSKRGFSAQRIAKWLKNRTGIHVHIEPPSEVFENLTLCFLCLLFSYYVYKRIFANKLCTKKEVLALVLVGFCNLMSTGCVWNYVYKPPLAASNEKLGTVIIYPDTNVQLMLETWIMMCLCE